MPSLLKSLYRILTLRCDESEQLISQSFDEQLPWVERWALRAHFISCWPCRRLRRQLTLVHQAGQMRGITSLADDGVEMPADVRQRIEMKIDRCCDDEDGKNK